MSSIAADLRLRLAPRSLPLHWLAAPALLGLGWLLPTTGVGLALRLAGATACLLLPGAVIARALGLDGLAPAFVWSLVALFAGMALMFAFHGSLWLAFAVMLAAGACALPFALRQPWPRARLSSLGVLALGAAAGISLWSAAAFGGDAFFHIGRIRKLLDFGSISLRTLDEFKDGGLHPGYAFPLWQGFMALVTRLAGVAAAAGALTLIHPPHAALVVIVLAGFLCARALLARRDLVPLGAALAAVIVPAGAVALWLLPVVRETVAHNPGTNELHRAFANYRNELDVFGLHRYRLKPELFGRAGIVSVAALTLLPLAVFARRRLLAAFALG